MRSRIRPWFLLFFSLLLMAAVSSAQVHGTPPSVTSLGFGGSNNPTPGVPASVTSLGPNGFGNGPNGCCFGPFFFANPSLFGQPTAHRHHHEFPIPVFVPAYVPYAVPYAEPDTADDDSADTDYSSFRSVPATRERNPSSHDAAAPRQAPRQPAHKADTAPSPVPPPDPEAAQPATVLVFKDGHKSDVQNYAIVGDTLFDFTDGLSHKILLAELDLAATQKANEERGVDFQIPAKTASADQPK